MGRRVSAVSSSVCCRNASNQCMLLAPDGDIEVVPPSQGHISTLLDVYSIERKANIQVFSIVASCSCRVTHLTREVCL